MNTKSESVADIRATAMKLWAYCQANEWAGYDPYDALNSRLLSSLPFLDSRIPRIALTQALKRSPVNLRPLLLIPKTQNPKGIALFLAASLKLPGVDKNIATQLVDMLIACRSQGTAHWCWGYSFPWQTRTLIVPRGTPNLVCTTFVAGALLDAYEQLGESRCLKMAVSAAEYILNDLYRTEGGSVAGFSYPLPSMSAQIHNANFLAAALFCRIFKLTSDTKFLEPALKVARYSAGRQRSDGAWAYGEGDTLQWVDNFHTGYNLCALRDIGRYLDTQEFDSHVRRGFEFYRKHFFREDGAARYFHNRTYPIDVHCVAQSIITLSAFRDRRTDSLSLAHSVFDWAMDNMWDERGFFYYRVLRFVTIRTSYMRWSQAWMLLALAILQGASPAAAVQPNAARLGGAA